MAKTIVIDAGHGGKDGGATANGLQEKDLTLDIAKRIQSKLKKYNIKVIMTRTTDKYLSLTERANIANKANADAFLSVHINAGGGTGFESYIYSGGVSSQTRTLQSNVHANIIKNIGGADRGKKSANFAVVRQTHMPALLTENLFIDRKEDAEKLKDSKFLDKVAQGHVDGIVKFLGLNKVSPSGKKQTSSKPSKPVKKSSKPSKTTSKYKANLTVDGKWGRLLTKALQRYFGTPVDGILSGQSRNAVTNALYGTASFGSGGSVVIKALQRYLNSNGFNLTVDGLLGPATVRALQSYLGTVQDGKLSRPSLVVKELQRRLNAGTF